MTSASSGKYFKCDRCLKSFSRSTHLAQHIRIHLGIKPYTCTFCDKTFTQMSHMQQHLRIHTGVKPYKCKYEGCTKAFAQVSTLLAHSRSHNKNLPFKCRGCHRNYKTQQDLMFHIISHVRFKYVKVNICFLCGMSYREREQLIEHISVKHNTACYEAPSIEDSMLTNIAYLSPRGEFIEEVKGEAISNDGTIGANYNPLGYNLTLKHQSTLRLYQKLINRSDYRRSLNAVMGDSNQFLSYFKPTPIIRPNVIQRVELPVRRTTSVIVSAPNYYKSPSGTFDNGASNLEIKRANVGAIRRKQSEPQKNKIFP